MSSKRFAAYAIHQPDETWTASVVRQRTGSGTTVERTRAGFRSWEAGQAWADEHLTLYLAEREVERQRKKERKRAGRAMAEARQGLSYQELASPPPGITGCKAELEWRSALLWDEVALGVLKEGGREQEAEEEADARVGARFSERLAKARDGSLDKVATETSGRSVARARTLAEIVAAGRNNR
jgi:hypothetical protein